jgi:murein DD-endopeptidase MepM/ murein hydrolase activator NlpD
MSMLQLDQLVVPVVLVAFIAALSALLPNTTMPDDAMPKDTMPKDTMSNGPVASPGARSPGAERSAAPAQDSAVDQAASAEALATDPVEAPSPAAPARPEVRAGQPVSTAQERPSPGSTPAKQGQVPSKQVPPLWPPVPGALSRGFEAPASPYGRGHRGLDLAAPAGTEVTAPAGGRVRFAGQVGGAGWVSVEIAPSVTVSIGPLTGITVRAGDDVGVETVVGKVAPGHGDGLHLGLRVDGAYTDPQPYLAEFDDARLVLIEPAARPDEGRQPGSTGAGRTARPASPAAPGHGRQRPRPRPRSATQPARRGGAATPRPAPKARRRSRSRGRAG